MNPINIIGIGQSIHDLTSRHLKLIDECDVLVGGKRQLAMFDTGNKCIIVVKSPVHALMENLRQKMHDNRIVVLASGDPLFYGIGSTMLSYFDRKDLNIYSNISSVSAGFALIKEPWHDAKIISLHSGRSRVFPFDVLKKEAKAAFLTGPDTGPHYIAAGLEEHGLNCFRICVLENIGSTEKEKITWFDSCNELKDRKFADPNMVILLKKPNAEMPQSSEISACHPGMPDSMFAHHRGLITKSEIRAIVLSRLKLTQKDFVLWDIGAGSGSVSIEAGLQLPQGQVYAVEKHGERINDIVCNASRFSCGNIRIIKNVFPCGIENMETPDRIFIGGGGRNLGKIMETACNYLRPSGVIVVNTVLIESLEPAVNMLEQLNFNPDIVQIQVSRAKKMPFGRRFDALNPVWIISGTKPDSRQDI
jgi:precorrin-6Y C5,15-methyltransferase (decarboxylating)